MNYIILCALLSGVLLTGWWIRYYLRKVNYNRYVEISASLLLAKERVQRRRANGSIIFQLQRHPENLENIRITSVKAMDDGVSIREFGGLSFGCHTDDKRQGNLCSVGVVLSDRILQRYHRDKGTVYIGGVMRFRDRTEKSFSAKLPVRFIDRQ